MNDEADCRTASATPGLLKRKYFAKKGFSVFKDNKHSTFKNTKTFFGNMFYYFFAFMKNDFVFIC